MTKPAENLDHVVDQPSNGPTRKWFAATGSGSATVLVLWIAGKFGLDLDPEAAGVIVLAVAQLAAYLKRNAPALVDCLDDEPGEHAADRG